MRYRDFLAAASFLAAALQFSPIAAAATACNAGNANTDTVRESAPAARFIVTAGDTSTVLDTLTGLEWKRCAQGRTDHTCFLGSDLAVDWQGALRSAAADTGADHTDWRLPNLKELESIVERCGTLPAINRTVFPQVDTVGEFWTSSTRAGFPTHAWFVGFSNGFTNIGAKTETRKVRIVRGGNGRNAFDAYSRFGCTADFDGDGKVDPLTDGLMFIRAAFGLTGTAVTANAIVPGATRNTWALIRAYMNQQCGTNFAP